MFLGAVPTQAIGDYVQVKGDVEVRDAAFQFKNTSVVTALTDTAPTVAMDPVLLTKEIADGFASDESITPAMIKKYSWTSTAAKSGGFWTLNLAGSSAVIEPLYVDSEVFPLVENTDYDIEAIRISYSSKYSYSGMMLTKATVHNYAVETVTVAVENDGAATLKATETLNLKATVNPAKAEQGVTWSSSNEAVATVSSEGVVSGLTEGTTTITATSTADTTKQGTLEVTVTAAPSDPVTSLEVDSETTILDMLEVTTKQITATVLPATANQSVTYSGFDETVVSVSATGLVTALKTGATTITVTTVGKDASEAVLSKNVAVTINQFAAGTDATIANLAAGTNVEAGKLYNVTGVLEGLDKTNKYGNSYITDVTSGKSVYCYGLTTTASAFSYADSAYSYKNATDSVTTLADYNNGDIITAKCVYAPNNGANRISAVALTRTADTTTKYAITKEATENGSFVVDKETAAYGETVTITPTAVEGYEIGLVSVETGYGTTALKAVENVYSFTATVINKVSVTFKKTVASTKVASYNLVGTLTSGANETNVLSQFTNGADTTTAGLSNIVTSISGLTNAYLGYTGYLNLGLKFGTSTKTGAMTLGLSSNVIKAVVKTTGWKTSDTLQVGDAVAQTPGVAYQDANAEQTLTFDFTSTNSLSFVYTNRGFISSIELYSLAA